MVLIKGFPKLVLLKHNFLRPEQLAGFLGACSSLGTVFVHVVLCGLRACEDFGGRDGANGRVPWRWVGDGVRFEERGGSLVDP